MALEAPLWLQNAAGGYPARVDRLLVSSLLTEGIIDVAAGELRVAQRAAGANMTVDIAPGRCVINGEQVADQGRYLCRSTAVENRAVAPAPASGSRTDLVVARVYDSTVAGVRDELALEVITGPAGGAVPATPSDAVVLAEIAVAAGTASITDAMITDRRRTTTPAVPHSRLIDAKGDLLVGSADDTLARLAPSGVVGRVLTEDPAEPLGVKWATGAAGGMEPLGEVNLAAAASIIEFTAIPQTYAHLMLVGQLRGTAATLQVDPYLRVNGSAAASYTYHLARFTGTTSTITSTAGSSTWHDVRVLGGNAAAGLFSTYRVFLPNYANATFQPAVDIVAQDYLDNTLLGGHFASAVAVTAISLALASGSYAAGSRVSLYGLKGA